MPSEVTVDMFSIIHESVVCELTEPVIVGPLLSVVSLIAVSETWAKVVVCCEDDGKELEVDVVSGGTGLG